MKPKYFLILSLLTSLLSIGCSKQPSDSIDGYKGMQPMDIYSQGMEHMEKGQYNLAIKDYEALEALYPYGKYAALAQLETIQAYYKAGKHPEALAASERFLKLYPRNEQVSRVYFLRGEIYQAMNKGMVYKILPLDKSKRESGSAAKAMENYAIVVKNYPNSSYAVEAKKRFMELKEQVAMHQVHIAKFYFDRNAYLAAISRSNYVIENFPDTDAYATAVEIKECSFKMIDVDPPKREI